MAFLTRAHGSACGRKTNLRVYEELWNFVCQSIVSRASIRCAKAELNFCKPIIHFFKVRGCIFEVFKRGHGSTCESAYEGFCESCGMFGHSFSSLYVVRNSQKNSASTSLIRVDV